MVSGLRLRIETAAPSAWRHGRRTGKHGTVAEIFGHNVPFALAEKYREKSRRKVQELNWTRTEIEYEPTGDLEFRVGADRWGGEKFRDTKKQRLEELLAKLVGAVMRDGRDRVLAAERARQQAIEQRKKEIQRLELRDRIQKRRRRSSS